MEQDSMDCLKCLVVSCDGPDANQIQLSIQKYLDEYIWEQDGLLLHTTRETPCPWKCPLPDSSEVEYMWSEIHHCGSVDDEWFLVFLLSYITDMFKGKVMAQVFSNEGQFMLTEAAHLLPSWVDSARHGSIDEIAHNRVWLYDGLLHLIPMRGRHDEDLSPKFLNMSRAVHAVCCSTTSTLAPARIQEFLFKCHLSRFPIAAQDLRHRAKVQVPKAAATVLMRSREICAIAARSFLERTANDMRTSMSGAQFWPESGSEDCEAMSTCMVTLRKSHYASLTAAKFSAPKAWPMPPPDAVALRKRAELGLKLTIGLNILVLRASMLSGVRFAEEAVSEARVKALPEWLRYMDALQNQGFFGSEVEGSAAHQRRCQHAKTAFLHSKVYEDIQKREATLLRKIQAFTDAPSTDSELANSAQKADDSEAYAVNLSSWLGVCCMHLCLGAYMFSMRHRFAVCRWMADEFGKKFEAYSHMQRSCGPSDTNSSRPVPSAANKNSDAQESSDLSAHDVMDRLSRFFEAGSSVTGAQTDPSSFSFDVEKMLQLLQGSKCSSPRRCDSDDVSDRSSGSVAGSDEHETHVFAQRETALDHPGDADFQYGTDDGGFMSSYMKQMETELSEMTSTDHHVNVDMESVANLLRSVTEGSDIQPGAGQGLFGMLGVGIPKTMNSNTHD